MSQNPNESSTPSFEDFDPTIIDYQDTVIDDVLNQYNYKIGTHEVLLSGSVGSAKSILMAHLAVRHCLEYPNARVLLGRKALPDLKATIFQKIVEHVGDLAAVKKITATMAFMKFRNGSEIISRSWSDKHYKKMRSLELSMAVIEELTENDDIEVYNEIKMRVGRLPHIPVKLIMCATNPDAPSHWAYDHFITAQSPTRHVYYSVTTDNPFLPAEYINQLKTDLDPKMARRMIYGEWIEIASEVVYYAYTQENNFRNYAYKPNIRFPVHLSWDFNIGEKKPLSSVAFQYIDGVMHVFDEVVVEGMRTAESCEEWEGKGIFHLPVKFYIHGDATGRSRDTRNKRSDYDIISNYFANHKKKVNFEQYVPLSNPPVRRRHNMVNAQCHNEAGKTRLFVYKDAPTADKALRLTQLKKGGNYIEDDSKPYQHIGTALGYGLHAAKMITDRKPQTTVRL